MVPGPGAGPAAAFQSGRLIHRPSPIGLGTSAVELTQPPGRSPATTLSTLAGEVAIMDLRCNALIVGPKQNPEDAPMSNCWVLPLISLSLAWQVPAPGPDNQPPTPPGAPTTKSPLNPRQFPPAGVAVPQADRALLEAGVLELGKAIDALAESLKAKPDLLSLLPDVRIYHNAVRYALDHNEFFRTREISVAKALLKQGTDAGKPVELKARHRGIPRTVWWSGATSPRSTVRCSPTAWSCRRPTSQAERRTKFSARRLVATAARREPQRGQLHR